MQARVAALHGDVLSDQEKAQLEEASKIMEHFNEVMDDDLNTADGLAAIFDLVKFANTTVSESSSAAYALGLKKDITTLTDVMGLIAEPKSEALDSEIEALIAERQEARRMKDFRRSDEIRDELLGRGIVLKDTREGVKWTRA